LTPDFAILIVRTRFDRFTRSRKADGLHQVMFKP